MPRSLQTPATPESGRVGSAFLQPSPSTPALIRRPISSPEGALPIVAILGTNRLLSDLLRRAVQCVAATATIFLATTAAEADGALAGAEADLLITDVVAADGDVLERLPRWMGPGGHVHHAFIVTSRREPAVLRELSRIPIEGAFDETNGGEAELTYALTEVMAGRGYWSQNLVTTLARERMDSNSAFRTLTLTEQIVLGIIGDGCDDKRAGELLNRRASTLKDIRRKLHRKLGVSYKGELLEAVARLGFVVRTPHGYLRPGLMALLQAEAKRKGGATPPSTSGPRREAGFGDHLVN